MDNNKICNSEILDYFINEILKEEAVIVLSNNIGLLHWKNEDEQALESLLVWSNAERAKQYPNSENNEMKKESIPLIEFFFLWLPDLFNRNLMLSIDFLGNDTDLCQIDSYELQNFIAKRMPKDLLSRYEETRAQNPSKYLYIHLGTFQNYDARPLLDSFDKENVRYDAGVDASQIKGMSACLAAYGGSSGINSSEIFITVHEDDMQKADDIQKRLFHI